MNEDSTEDVAEIPERWQRLHRFDYDVIRLPRPVITGSPDAASLAAEVEASHRRRLRGA